MVPWLNCFELVFLLHPILWGTFLKIQMRTLQIEGNTTIFLYRHDFGTSFGRSQGCSPSGNRQTNRSRRRGSGINDFRN